MPMGALFHSPAPKSVCTPEVDPMVLIHVEEFGETGN